MRAIPAVIGAIGLTIGLLGLGGVVPLSSTTGTFGVAFTASATGFVATVVDQTVLPSGCSLLLFPILSWGDGTISTMGLMGSQTHTYSIANVYTVTEVVLEMCGLNAVRGQAVASLEIPGPSAVTSSTVTAGFSCKSSGLTVSATDTSVPNNAVVDQVTFLFGVSGASAQTTGGGTVSYTYASGGTYVLNETVLWNPIGSPALRYGSWVQTDITVASGLSASCSTSSGSAAASTFNAVTGLLIIGFGGLIVAAVIPAPIWVRVGMVATFFILGPILGYIAGGWGLL